MFHVCVKIITLLIAPKVRFQLNHDDGAVKKRAKRTLR